MKKLLISLLSLVALTSFAKTADELVTEYWSKAAGMDDYAVAKAIVNANKADLPAAIEAWSKGEAGKFDAKDKRSEQSKKDVQAARMLAGAYIVQNLNSFDITKLPVLFACEVVSTQVVKAYEVSNPTFYSELKAADFKVDGIKLRTHAICNIAISAGDMEYVMSLPLQEVINNVPFREALVKHLLKMPVAEAKAKVVEIENWYIERNREIPANIKAVSKVLTSRLVDAKLQGK